MIDTVGIKVGPFPTADLYAMVDLFGTPHTPALHVVERYRLLDHEAAKAIEQHNHEDNFAPPMVDNGIARDPGYKGKGLQLELTVEDEGVFTMRWSASMIYWPVGPDGAVARNHLCRKRQRVRWAQCRKESPDAKSG